MREATVLLRIFMLALLLLNVIFLRHFAAICIVPICGVIIKMILKTVNCGI